MKDKGAILRGNESGAGIGLLELLTWPIQQPVDRSAAVFRRRVVVGNLANNVLCPLSCDFNGDGFVDASQSSF